MFDGVSHELGIETGYGNNLRVSLVHCLDTYTAGNRQHSISRFELLFAGIDEFELALTFGCAFNDFDFAALFFASYFYIFAKTL
jgi:hypothetical protein